MFDLWDTAFFGKTFPRNVKIDLSKWRIAYVNETKDEVIDDSPKVAVIKALDRPAPPCRKDNCGEPRAIRTGNFTLTAVGTANKHYSAYPAASSVRKGKRKNCATNCRIKLQKRVDK